MLPPRRRWQELLGDYTHWVEKNRPRFHLAPDQHPKCVQRLLLRRHSFCRGLAWVSLGLVMGRRGHGTDSSLMELATQEGGSFRGGGGGAERGGLCRQHSLVVQSLSKVAEDHLRWHMLPGLATSLGLCHNSSCDPEVTGVLYAIIHVMHCLPQKSPLLLSMFWPAVGLLLLSKVCQCVPCRENICVLSTAAHQSTSLCLCAGEQAEQYCAVLLLLDTLLRSMDQQAMFSAPQGEGPQVSHPHPHLATCRHSC